jgi:hypothetical protein
MHVGDEAHAQAVERLWQTDDRKVPLIEPDLMTLVGRPIAHPAHHEARAGGDETLQGRPPCRAPAVV